MSCSAVPRHLFRLASVLSFLFASATVPLGAQSPDPRALTEARALASRGAAPLEIARVVRDTHRQSAAQAAAILQDVGARADASGAALGRTYGRPHRRRRG